MTSRRPRPLFSATPEVHGEIPAESQHPGSFTSRLRRWLLSDSEPLFTAERWQRGFQQKLEEPPHNRGTKESS